MSPPRFSRFLVQAALSRPLVVYAAMFAAGIGIGSLGLVWVFACCAASAFAAALTLRIVATRTIHVAAGFLVAGALRGLLFFTVEPTDVSRLAGTALVTVEGRVTGEPTLRSDRYSVPMEVDSYSRAGASGRCTGSLIAVASNPQRRTQPTGASTTRDIWRRGTSLRY
jgi:hypothetical protein